MNLIELNGVKVYNLTSYFKLPEWASRSEKRKYFKKDPNAAKNFQLIQELEMPDSSTYVTCSPDQQYLFLLGRYKPRVRCYELNNLSMKFDRCVDYLPLHMTFFSEDYSKFALVQEDRWIDVHYAGGHFFKFRIPKPGIDSCYCPYSCDLFITSSQNYIYRMNLHEGRFNTPIQVPVPKNSKFSFTASAYDNYYNILMASSTLGRVDGWDTRCSDRIFGLDVSSHALRPEEFASLERKPGQISCTSLLYKDSTNIAVGTGQGMVHIYDIRQNKKPWHTRDTGYRSPVKSLAIHDDKLLAMVSHCVKIWNIDDGKIFVGFDTGSYKLNSMHHMKNTGLVFLANEAPKCMTYFIPLLGEAPSWAHHLDQLVYEFEPEATAMYDGYKFLTRQQLSEYGMLDLIGSSFLRAYMHGYFISVSLFEKIRQKLGLTEQSKPAKLQPDSQQQLSKKALAVAPEEKLATASADNRFAKLQNNTKMAFSSREQEAELMRIHEARLQKKRRRKEQRIQRAEWSQKLIKGSTGASEHEPEASAADSSDDSDSS
ncbi:Nucleolar protein 10 [Cichlidogyrus casuarinus]|uniref:Nucleolar protein 10 n=1 Tax=Cichlidogyrus casuarinus TaxID=1844966 RepID=A0ABD2Q705_9PLAT